MGGIAGFWTRSEESILEGSHEVQPDVRTF